MGSACNSKKVYKGFYMMIQAVCYVGKHILPFFAFGLASLLGNNRRVLRT